MISKLQIRHCDRHYIATVFRTELVALRPSGNFRLVMERFKTFAIILYGAQRCRSNLNQQEYSDVAACGYSLKHACSSTRKIWVWVWGMICKHVPVSQAICFSRTSLTMSLTDGNCTRHLLLVRRTKTAWPKVPPFGPLIFTLVHTRSFLD